MSRRRKAVVGLAGLALAGGACLGGVAAAPVAGAASPACGSSCVSLYNQKFGSTDVSAVSGGTAATGQAVILDVAAPSTIEDWSPSFQGAVSDFYAAGLMNATLNKYYGSDPVYEFQYTPGGVDSGECLGIASGPGQGTEVTLQPCTAINSTWIDDAAAASGGYVPYISGSDTKYPAPYVLTAADGKGDFTTQALSVNLFGTVATDQMWQLISGVLATPSSNYAGWSVTGLTGTHRYVAADWTVPSVQCLGQWLHPSLLPSNAWAAPWVGLAGGPDLSQAWLSQVGTYSQCTDGVNPTFNNYAFVELYSQLPGGEPPKKLFEVHPGDKMFGQVQDDGEVNGQLRLFSSIKDLTTGQSAAGYIFPTNGTLANAEYQAIVTVENYNGQGLAEFDSPIQFTGVQFSPGTGLTQFTMVGSSPTFPLMAVAGPLSPSPAPNVSSAFTVTWKRWN